MPQGRDMPKADTRYLYKRNGRLKRNSEILDLRVRDLTLWQLVCFGHTCHWL